MRAHTTRRIVLFFLLCLISQTLTSARLEEFHYGSVATGFDSKEDDRDGDSVSDQEELWIAQTFAPVYFYDGKERNTLTGMTGIREYRDVVYFYQVNKAHCDQNSTSKIAPSPRDFWVLTVVATYAYDFVPVDNKFAHYGDTEMVRVCLKQYTSIPSDLAKRHGAIYKPKKLAYVPELIIIKRHTAGPRSHTSGQLEWDGVSHIKLYVSRGKHAAYRTIGECEDYPSGIERLGWEEDCPKAGTAQIIRPDSLKSDKYNVGEAAKPLIVKTRLFDQPRMEYVWGNTQRFCGGYNVKSPDKKRKILPFYDESYCSGSLAGKWVSSAPQYKVMVLTSDIKGAGTDANIYLYVSGSLGDAGFVFIDNKDSNFEKGYRDEFLLSLSDLGEIASLCVFHDNSGDGSGWHVKSIEISKGDKKWTFQFSQWLALDESPNRLWACRPKDQWPKGIWNPY